MRHEPHRAIQGSRFPVTLSTEAIALGHQTLRGKSWNLVETNEFRVVYVLSTQVVEVGGESLGTLFRKDRAKGQLSLGGIPYLFAQFGVLVFKFGGMVILFQIGVEELVGLLVGYFLPMFHEFRNGAIVDVIAQHLLGTHLITIGNGNIVHLVAETKDQHVLSVCPTGTNPCPYGDVLLSLLLLPMANHYLARNSESCTDMSELAVTVSALVEVHEVHVDFVPWNFRVILCVEVE